MHWSTPRRDVFDSTRRDEDIARHERLIKRKINIGTTIEFNKFTTNGQSSFEIFQLSCNLYSEIVRIPGVGRGNGVVSRTADKFSSIDLFKYMVTLTTQTASPFAAFYCLNCSFCLSVVIHAAAGFISHINYIFYLSYESLVWSCDLLLSFGFSLGYTAYTAINVRTFVCVVAVRFSVVALRQQISRRTQTVNAISNRFNKYCPYGRDDLHFHGFRFK